MLDLELYIIMTEISNYFILSASVSSRHCFYNNTIQRLNSNVYNNTIQRLNSNAYDDVTDFEIGGFHKNTKI